MVIITDFETGKEKMTLKEFLSFLKDKKFLVEDVDIF
jgi:hypothetical protein